MGPGQKRKRLLKLARRIAVEQIRASVQNSPDSHPRYFVLRQHGMELLCSWHWMHGQMEVTIEDDVEAVAVSEYLKGLGLVFDSSEAALAYGREQGFLE